MSYAVSDTGGSHSRVWHANMSPPYQDKSITRKGFFGKSEDVFFKKKCDIKPTVLHYHICDNIVA